MPSNRLTAEQLAAIRARAEAATPGPWSAHHRSYGLTADHDEFGGLGLEIEGPPEAFLRGQFARGTDAQFIAASRTDTPALLAHIEELELERGRLLGVLYVMAQEAGCQCPDQGYRAVGEHESRFCLASESVSQPDASPPAPPEGETA